nr:O-phospho-L-seryl-tRNA:Cys-tRNA synthase [Candidatus Sigynarchaeota archaeon]
MPISEEELKKFKNLSRENEDRYINLQPIQRGGVLPLESRKVLFSYGDGYSMCDFCFSGRIDEIETPAVSEFLPLFAKFIDMDAAMPTGSSREAKKIAIQQLAKRASPGKHPVLIIDGLAHYSTYIAAESAGAATREVPHNGNPEFRLDVEGYAAEIDKAVDDSKNEVIGALLTHSDYLYGNVT